MIFGSLMMVIAITISAIAAWYSIAGLTAIFSAAVIPVMIMGGALEAGKIAATVWLHNNWERAGWKFKTYLVPAIVFLMLLTSMGIFGFLSKAHSDQGLVTGDALSKVSIYDEKIATERDNINQAKRALEQMNAQVDQMLGRTDTDRGAERAVQIRKQQARERAALQAEITRSQKVIQKLQEERAPLAAETRKIEAEVGPIKYIAALIYGDNPDQNILEKAVRWVIILIVVVFDPLALTLILAANKQFEWAREGRGGWVHKEEEHPNVAAANNEEPLVEDEVPHPPLESAQVHDQITDAVTAPAPLVRPELDNHVYDDERLVSKFDKQELAKDLAVTEEEEEFFKTVKPAQVLDDVAAMNIVAEPAGVEIRPFTQQEIDALNTDYDVPDLDNKEEDTLVTEATNIIAEPPLPEPINEYNTPIRRGNDYAVRYRGKTYNLDAFNNLYPNLAIEADNRNNNTNTDSNYGFGDQFPINPRKGDMFIRTDYLPERLFKWNGAKWIEIDKNTTDGYTYNQAYIEHLIQKLEAGEYEIEDLNDAERAQVEEQIQKILQNKNV